MRIRVFELEYQYLTLEKDKPVLPVANTTNVEESGISSNKTIEPVIKQPSNPTLVGTGDHDKLHFEDTLDLTKKQKEEVSEDEDKEVIVKVKHE